MNQNEFTFEDTQDSLMSASEFLRNAEGLDEQALEALFEALEDSGTLLDLSGLPRMAPSGQAALRLREEMEQAKKPDLREGLEKTDALRIYLEELLSQPEPSGAEGALIRGMKQVTDIAREYTGYGVLLLDLIQEGNIGLWQAISTDEASREQAIRQAMIKAILRQAVDSGLGQKLRQAVEDYRMADERLLTDLGRNPTPEEMAEYLHMTVEEVENVRKTLENARMVDKAHAQPEPDEEEAEEDQAVEDTAYYQTRERVNDLMSGLTELETEVLNLRYGLNGKPPLSLADTSRKLKLTTGQITKIEQTALAKMRAQ